MKTVYDISKHSHCVSIHLGNDAITIKIQANWCRLRPFSNSPTNAVVHKVESCIIFEIETGKVLSRGSNKDFVYDGEKHFRIENFRDQLYRIFKKGVENRDDYDIFVIHAISVYLDLTLRQLDTEIEVKVESFDAFHYAFILPSEWEKEIRENLLRPMFIQGDLLHEGDHEDRLLFFSDIECICYRLENINNDNHYFERGNDAIICRFAPIENDNFLVKLDLVHTMNPLYNFPNSRLFPKVKRSSSFYIDDTDIQCCIKSFLEEKLLPIDQDHVMEALATYIYYDGLPDQFPQCFDGKLVDLLNVDTDWCILSDTQKMILKSLRIFELCANICKTLFSNLNDLLSDNTTKKYKVITFADFYSYGLLGDSFLAKWMNCTLVCRMCSSNSIKSIFPKYCFFKTMLSSGFLLEGAICGVFETIQNSNLNCKPRLLPIESEVLSSSSIFLNSRPNAIVYIDISLKSTLLSCALLDDHGLVEEVFDHSYFTVNRGLSSLGSFYKISNIASLDVNEQFIQFAESYLLGNNFCADKNATVKENIISEIETILNVDYSSGAVLISTQQQVYLKAFFLMYMVYIKESISSNLPVRLTAGNDNINIGYVVSIEMILLDNIIGTKDDLRDIIYTSGLTHSEDNSKKLRIITQGEGYLPTIKEKLKLKLQLGSNFVLVQLHEDYIQLTLNQVVTESDVEDKEEEQESIILLDKIIHVQNVYDSLCLNMWNNVLESCGVIQLCDIHDERGDTAETLLFSLRIKKYFMSNIKDYISNKLFAKTSDWKDTDVDLIQLGDTCGCHIFLTVEDILDISFKPVIQDIVSLLSASLVNTDILGHYANIEYMFTFICFNYNARFQNILQRIFKEKMEDLNQEVSHFFIPGPLNQYLQLFLKKQPFMYEGFRIGTLHQVYSSNCASFLLESSDEKLLLCKTKKSDTKGTALDGWTGHLLVKKGDILNDSHFKRLFYLKPQQIIYKKYVDIIYEKFDKFYNIKSDETVSLEHNARISWVICRMEWECIQPENDIPIIISVISQNHCSSLQISVRVAGKDVDRNHIIELGETMTLRRF